MTDHALPERVHAIKQLPQLMALRLNDTFLGFKGSNGGLALAEALELKSQPLTVLELAANRLNRVLVRWHLPAMPIQFKNTREVEAFFAHLPST